MGKPPYIGKRSEGEAREMNCAGIEDHLSEHTTEDPSKSYNGKFDIICRLNVHLIQQADGAQKYPEDKPRHVEGVQA